MANTYTLISSVTVGSGGASSINFTSIPSTYTDLCIKLSARGTLTGVTWQNLRLRFNSDSASNYSYKLLAALSGSVLSASETSTYLRYSYGTYADATASTFSNAEYYITNYTSSNNKSISYDSVAENNSSTVYALALTAGLWNNSAALSSIAITPDAGGDWAQYSTAYLYGISNA
jgi:hypothetical protein